MSSEPHKTKDGYCCACSYDIAVFKDEIAQAKEEMKKDIQKPWIKKRKNIII